MKRGREFLEALQAKGGDAGPQSLAEIEPDKSQLIPGQIPRQRDIEQLFDTSVDLAGHDIDVSRFIRQSEDLDVAIAWRQWQGDKPPTERYAKFHADELCRVRIGQARAFLKLIRDKHSLNAWRWNPMTSDWDAVQPSDLYPGQTLLLPLASGGYTDVLGFTGNPTHQPREIQRDAVAVPAFESDDRDGASFIGVEVLLVDHARRVSDRLKSIVQELQPFNLPADLLERAGRWHDLGKAMEIFQKVLNPDYVEGASPFLAKSADPSRRLTGDRRAFRHELASALVALESGEPFLLCYLVAAHHGKVRLTIQPRPTEPLPQDGGRFALGIREGDQFPKVDLGAGVETAERHLSLACMEFGGDRSWTGQALQLLDEHGPFRLAFLEMLLRVADQQASMAEKRDGDERDELVEDT